MCFFHRRKSSRVPKGRGISYRDSSGFHTRVFALGMTVFFFIFIPSLAMADPSPHYYFTIQFKGRIFESQKEKIQRLGGEILFYVPVNRFAARLSPDVQKKIATLPFIQSIAPFERKHPLLSHLASLSSKRKDSSPETKNLIVEFFHSENIAAILKKLRKNGIKINEVSNNLVRISANHNTLSSLEKIEGISWIEEDIEFAPLESPLSAVFEKPFDELTGYETGIRLLDSEKLTTLGLSGHNEILGYSDTGLDVGIDDDTLHHDFHGRIRSAYALKDANWKDIWGHGTHVAGLLAGNGKLSEEKIRGSAFDAKLVVQSLLTNDGFRVPLEIGERLLLPAYNDGSRIHSNSWGSKLQWGSYSPYSKSIDRFVWEHPDMLVVFSAGNSAGDFNKDGVVDEGSILIPATAKNCLTVGASENWVSQGGVQVNWQWIGVKTERWHVDPVASDLPSDHPNGIAAFSSRGPTRDNRIKPDVVAPGTNILSTRSHVPGGKNLWGPFSEDYIWSGGSSMSAPLVASGIALVREYLRTQKKMESPTSALLKALIINSAVELYPGQFGEIEKKEIPKRRPNMQEGWGRVNIARAVLETETRKIFFDDETKGLATSEVKEYLFEVVEPQEPIAITLVYHDYPAALSTIKYLVNDLDLEAIDSDGKIYFPNGLAQKDDTNNVEGIDILAPKRGDLRVKIKAFNIPQGKNGKQPWAFVISGGIAEKKI